MAVETIFLICNYGVIPFWVLLCLAPRAKVTDLVVHSPVPALFLVPTYALLLFTDHPGPQGSSFFTLEGVSRIFTTPQTIAACWIHYLVFDLFVGAWEARDAHRLDMPRLVVIPCLVLTLLFGPIGFFAYLVLRGAMRRRFTLIEA
ncbi:MAG: DUF4281 domain-containing protein [Polyangiaceae bacterium]|nr:DUF4281 domain-containing protein [Polyangiaceae bacterium]